mmetsp:Transcript_63988/g.162167  ORF Transcript_63988/g.162167 Transcript_63988/m.162167 type:complete len:99 (-) Transcript_63988:65-361(-)
MPQCVYVCVCVQCASCCRRSIGSSLPHGITSIAEGLGLWARMRILSFAIFCMQVYSEALSHVRSPWQALDRVPLGTGVRSAWEFWAFVSMQNAWAAAV